MSNLSVTAFLLTAALVAACGKSEQERAAEAEQLAAAASAAAEEAQRASDAATAAEETVRLTTEVANRLKDPASAQYRNVSFQSDSSALCGEVNAKNAYGGYVGFRRFVATDSEVQIEGERKVDRTEDLVSRLGYKTLAAKSGCPTVDE